MIGSLKQLSTQSKAVRSSYRALPCARTFIPKCAQPEDCNGTSEMEQRCDQGAPLTTGAVEDPLSLEDSENKEETETLREPALWRQVYQVIFVLDVLP
jgi:hypothetical protein